MMTRSLAWLSMMIVTVIMTQAQQGRWLPADDATAKFILDAEEQWDEAACTHNKSAETVLADDFLGTAPDGTTYTKAEEVKDTEDTSKSAQQCHQIGSRVRLFGDNVAMVYGNAFSVRGSLSTREDLLNYLKMLRETRDAVAKAMHEGKTLDQMKRDKLLDPWKKYAGEFVSPDAYLETIFNSLARHAVTHD